MAQLRKISMSGFSNRGIRFNVAVRPSSEKSDWKASSRIASGPC